jgi:transcription antitermination protein NusB
MAVPRQKFREIVFQLLYSHDFAESDEKDMTSFMMHEFAVSKKTVRLAVEQKNLIQLKQDAIDRLISQVSKAYDFERISRVERNILRLGAFELIYEASVPPKVAITEAIRLTRKFGSPEGAAFVNAILDAIYTEEKLHDNSLEGRAG